jgi:hypothetical protein
LDGEIAVQTITVVIVGTKKIVWDKGGVMAKYICDCGMQYNDISALRLCQEHHGKMCYMSDTFFGKEINELKERLTAVEKERDELRVAVIRFLSGANHNRLFLSSRQRIHPDGLKIYDEDIAALREAVEGE